MHKIQLPHYVQFPVLQFSSKISVGVFTAENSEPRMYILYFATLVWL